VVAGAFVFSDLVMMKYLAFGLLIALLLDATIVRMFLVPAIMKMLGDDCWWAPRWMKRLQNKIGLGEIYLPDERKRPGYGESEVALVGATAAVSAAAVGGAAVIAAPVRAAPEIDAPTTRFRAAKADDNRDIGSWLGELRNKARRTAGVETSEEPTEVTAGPSIAPVITEDATTAIPRQSPSISAEATRAIPVSRPGSVDSEVATEQLNARAKGRG